LHKIYFGKLHITTSQYLESNIWNFRKLLTRNDSASRMAPSTQISAVEIQLYFFYPAMESVALELKLAREKRKISLAQIAADTHISMRHLESLEDGRYGDLPGGIYNRAFLRAYCERLDLDQREIIRRYEEEMLPLAEKLPKSKVHIPPQNTSPQISPVIIWGIMLLISATGLFFSRKWISAVFSPYFNHTPANKLRFEPPQMQVVPPTPAIQPESGSNAPSVLSPTPSGASKTEAPEAEFPSGNKSDPALTAAQPALRLELAGTEKCWISIDRDGSLALRKLLEPGEVQTFDAEEKFWLVIGNAGGIRLKINGKPLRQLGLPGEVRRLLIDKKSLPDLLDTTAG
jgi:cytoskeleton protein RodZ